MRPTPAKRPPAAAAAAAAGKGAGQRGEADGGDGGAGEAIRVGSFVRCRNGGVAREAEQTVDAPVWWVAQVLTLSDGEDQPVCGLGWLRETRVGSGVYVEQAAAREQGEERQGDVEEEQRRLRWEEPVDVLEPVEMEALSISRRLQNKNQAQPRRFRRV
jgi:hypothetical protein